MNSSLSRSPLFVSEKQSVFMNIDPYIGTDESNVLK